MKLAVIGGGSTYTPELVDGIARLSSDVAVEELVLVDPDESRLAVVGPFSDRVMRAHGHPGRLSWTTGLDEGLDGAGAVLVQLRVGGQAARQRDETWPLEYGCVGQETTGAGGLAKALRTVPTVLDIAERARQRALDSAWIIDFTNPVGIVTRALLDAGHRAIGLCNVAIGFQRNFAALLGVDPAEVMLDHVGLNHLTWERAAVVDGADVLPDLIASHGDEVARLEKELLAAYADPALTHKPEMLSQRGGAFYSEAAVALLASLTTGAGDVQVVNLRNRGTLPFLDDDAVIEVPAVIGTAGAQPVPVAPLHPTMRGLVAHVSAYEELAVDAALRGGRGRVAGALLAHPLIGQYDLAGRLADRLIAENAAYLPWASGDS